MSDYLTYPDSSKVWVYQSDQPFSEDELNYLTVRLDDFVSSWESHGSLLKATFQVFHQLFVVFFVDEEGDAMCGRAQDASVRFMKELEEQLEVSFLDRTVQAYKKDDKVEVFRLADFQALVESGELSEQTVVFNNTVANKLSFDESWEIPLKDSWHNQLLVKA